MAWWAMSVMRSVLAYLGLAQRQVKDGFAVPDRRAGQLVVCRTCAARVAMEGQHLHVRWQRA